MARRLRDFEYRAATVLPFAKWPRTSHKYYLLGKEAYGPNTDTWDAFGGARDEGESHPVVTAAREFAEETMLQIFDTTEEAVDYITLNNGNTENIVANETKQGAVYITRFKYSVISHFIRNFFSVRHTLLKMDDTGHLTEKKGLAWIRDDLLAEAITYAPRDDKGKLIHPIMVEGNVLLHDGTFLVKQIPLRPILVSSLQSYFADLPNYEIGADLRIRFYQR